MNAPAEVVADAEPDAIRECAVRIPHPAGCLYGILHAPEAATSAVVMIPASTGTRTGPQQLFVHVARALARGGFAVLRVDLASGGDSWLAQPASWSEPTLAELDATVDMTLRAATEYLHVQAGLGVRTVLSISQSCLAALGFARRAGIPEVIMLSPNLLLGTRGFELREKLGQYMRKLHEPATWRRAARLELDLKAIATSLLRSGRMALDRGVRKRVDAQPAIDGLTIFTIHGERDAALASTRRLWQRWRERGAEIHEFIVPGADHSFFGWQFKESVAAAVVRSLVRHG